MLNQLNGMLDRVERSAHGQRLVRALITGVGSAGSLTLGLGAGMMGTHVAAKPLDHCAVCCFDYKGYSCSECNHTSSTPWVCTNNCGNQCSCPDCYDSGNNWHGHCNDGCGY